MTESTNPTLLNYSKPLFFNEHPIDKSFKPLHIKIRNVALAILATMAVLGVGVLFFYAGAIPAGVASASVLALTAITYSIYRQCCAPKVKSPAQDQPTTAHLPPPSIRSTKRPLPSQLITPQPPKPPLLIPPSTKTITPPPSAQLKIELPLQPLPSICSPKYPLASQPIAPQPPKPPLLIPLSTKTITPPPSAQPKIELPLQPLSSILSTNPLPSQPIAPKPPLLITPSIETRTSTSLPSAQLKIETPLPLPFQLQTSVQLFQWQKDLFEVFNHAGRFILPSNPASQNISANLLRKYEGIIKDHAHELNTYVQGQPLQGTILHVIAKMGYPCSLIPILAQNGINFGIRETGAFKNTALVWAIANACNVMAMEIINYCPSHILDYTSVKDTTALHLVIAKGYTTHDSDGYPVYYSNYKLMVRLIECGAKVNLQDKNGSTPLHLACVRHDHEVIKYLLEHGADKTIRNKDGKTPYDLIGSMDYKAAISYIGFTVLPFLILLESDSFETNRQLSLNCFAS